MATGLKVGDKVRICEELPVCRSISPSWGSAMDEFCGCEAVVRVIDEDDDVQLTIDGSVEGWWFNQSWLTKLGGGGSAAIAEEFKELVRKAASKAVELLGTRVRCGAEFGVGTINEIYFDTFNITEPGDENNISISCEIMSKDEESRHVDDLNELIFDDEAIDAAELERITETISELSSTQNECSTQLAKLTEEVKLLAKRKN